MVRTVPGTLGAYMVAIIITTTTLIITTKINSIINMPITTSALEVGSILHVFVQ